MKKTKNSSKASKRASSTAKPLALETLDFEQLTRIRERTEKQRNRYGFHWNQLLRDRRDLLLMVDYLLSKHEPTPEEICSRGLSAYKRFADDLNEELQSI